MQDAGTQAGKVLGSPAPVAIRRLPGKRDPGPYQEAPNGTFTPLEKIRSAL